MRDLFPGYGDRLRELYRYFLYHQALEEMANDPAGHPILHIDQVPLPTELEALDWRETLGFNAPPWREAEEAEQLRIDPIIPELPIQTTFDQMREIHLATSLCHFR